MKTRLSVMLLPLFLLSNSNSAQDDEALALLTEIARMEQEITLLEDKNEIENLQRIYGFYTDKHQWSQAADLFAEDGSVEIGGEGVYVGKESILAYFQASGAEGPQEGILDDHMQLQPVVHVSPDGTAQGRWHHFSQEAEFGVSHHWGTGIYENEYVKENGVWKIKALHLFSTMRTPFDDGWHVTAQSLAEARSEASTIVSSDLPPSVAYENYPSVYVVPFHYDNPVTGNVSGSESPEGFSQRVISTQSASGNTEITLETASGVRLFSTENIDDIMAELETRLGLLEDADEVERLQTIYGYYLARNQWDDFTGLFTPDGSIEIAMRGVYRGKASVRRNLNLYGVQDELPGELHNHMQYQPVIHIAEDGQSAQLRSRAFSMMGTFGNQGRWMGGTYENIFQKRDGVWMMFKDQQINTYFAGTDDGWINLTRSGPPGITESNPPDEAPSMPFEMYPKAFLPPYHYDNPVTGRSEVAE